VRVPGESIKWFYAADSAVMFAIVIVLFFRNYIGLTPSAAQTLAMVADKPLHWALIAIALTWVHESWRGVADVAGDMTPGKAVGHLFIPFYNVYWMFAVNSRLCDALDQVLAEAGDRRRGPRDWAAIAAGLQLGINVFQFGPLKSYYWAAAVISHVAWIAYMLSCDPIRRAAWEARVRADARR
jgi:hypothetical protein